MTTPLRYRSYAKINLYLDVLNRREDGYHNIETIFQSVSLFDELLFTPAAANIALTTNIGFLSTGEDNLVYRAALLLQQFTGTSNGIQIHLHKKIPIAAGLAGGSGNAAATLCALNKLWQLQLPQSTLQTLGLRLGSDVPFCLLGGTAAATGRGEKITLLPPLQNHAFILLHPPIGVSAREAYSHPLLGHNHETAVMGQTASFRRALQNLQAGRIADTVFNRMQAPIFHEHPQLHETRQSLLDLGCTAAAMSGSGPTIFGVCTSVDQAHEIASRFTSLRTSVVTPERHGIADISSYVCSL